MKWEVCFHYKCRSTKVDTGRQTVYLTGFSLKESTLIKILLQALSDFNPLSDLREEFEEYEIPKLTKDKIEHLYSWVGEKKK